MSDWDSYVRDDVQQGGGEGWETVPEDVYDAVCIEVGEPYERDTQFGTKMKFVVRWRISGGDLDGDVEIPQFVTLSDSDRVKVVSEIAGKQGQSAPESQAFLLSALAGILCKGVPDAPLKQVLSRMKVR